MAISITVTPTDGENEFAITPEAVDGPLGDTNTTDLNLLGMGKKRYGSQLNSDLYRLLESFSCPERIFSISDISATDQINLSGDLTEVFSSGDTIEIVNSSVNDGQYTVDTVTYYQEAHNTYPDQTVITLTTSNLNQSTVDGQVGYPGWPQNEHSLGYGNGINYPVQGQVWYNNTSGQLLIYDGQTWKSVNKSIASDDQPIKPPEDGELWYDTANNQLKVYDEGMSNWLSVAYQYLRLDGTEPMQADLDVGNHKVINVSTPTAADHATTKDYVDSEISSLANNLTSNYLPLDGTSTMQGDLDLGSYNVINMNGPNNGSDAATKSYVDTVVSNALTNLDGTDGIMEKDVVAIFQQSSAPNGWTQNTNLNDRVLRVVNGSGGGTGGGWTITGLNVHGHQLTVNEMPSHNHRVGMNNNEWNNQPTYPGGVQDGWEFSVNSGTTGGDQAHDHGISQDGNWRPAYVDVISATKN